MPQWVKDLAQIQYLAWELPNIGVKKKKKSDCPKLLLSIRKGYFQEILIYFLSPLFLSATSAILTAEQALYPLDYEIPILVKDSFNRACELPQIVALKACDCDSNHVCLYLGTTGIHTGDGSSVTSVSVTDDQTGTSNVGLGPTGMGMIALGLLLLLCKYWITPPLFSSSSK